MGRQLVACVNKLAERVKVTSTAVLCPGQGAQYVGMGAKWCAASTAAADVFKQADEILDGVFSAPLSTLCFEGPAEELNKTSVSQPAIYTCSVASYHGLIQMGQPLSPVCLAGLSLGEYTALHLADAFDFDQGLKLVTERGRLMQQAAEASDGGMLALIGADEEQAESLCEQVSVDGAILVPANFNAPGQIVLSGQAAACERAAAIAAEQGLRATPLTVAGAFHSPLMELAGLGLASALASSRIRPLATPVWSNVTAKLHHQDDEELLRERLVQQLTSPVRWSQSCSHMIESGPEAIAELAPGTVLRGLMRRIDRAKKVVSHDEPQDKS